MRRPRPIFRRRRKPPPPRTPTTDDLLALLGADWHALKARRGLRDRVVAAVRRTGAGGATGAVRARPRRLRTSVLAGAAGAFLLAFAAGLIESGRGGVHSGADESGRAADESGRAADESGRAADESGRPCPKTVPAPAPHGGLRAPAAPVALPGPDPDAPHPLDDPARPAGREGP